MKPSRRATKALKTRACRYCAEADQDKLKAGRKPCNKLEIRHGACVNFRQMKNGTKSKKKGRN
jgi:hypothetical protein